MFEYPSGTSQYRIDLSLTSICTAAPLDQVVQVSSQVRPCRTAPQDQCPSSRVTAAGGEAGVNSMTSGDADNKGAARAEAARDSVSKSSSLAAAAR